MTSVKKTWQLYCCEKVNEGGLVSQEDAIRYLHHSVGVVVRKAHCPYVGQYGLDIYGTKRQHEEVDEYLYGRMVFVK